MEQFEQLDHYGVLGVSRSATAEEIKRAYRQQMARYHPDRFAGASPDDRMEAGRRAQRINEAYQVLSDFAARTAYNRTLAPEARVAGAQRPASPAPAPAPRDHLAELYEQARAHLDAGRALQAAATLRELQAINPFYRDSAALLQQAEAAARRPAPVAAPRPDAGRRRLLLGGLSGLLLAGAGALAWATRRQGASAADTGAAGGLAAGAAPTTPATAAPALARTAAPTVAPTLAPTLPPTVAPTSEPTAAATAAPTLQPTAAPTAPPATPTPAPLAEEGAVAYAENFARRAGWPVLAGTGWSVGFADGAYQITASQGVGNIWAFSTSPLGEAFQVGVDVEVSGGIAGLLLRYSDRSYLAYTVDPTAGAYRLEQWGGGRGSVIAAEAHPAVAAGVGARNRLVARLEGEQVALRVNGVPVADLAVASPPPTARYGMLAFATAAEVVALFRDLVIREL